MDAASALAALAPLAGAVIEDDGSLAARLGDQPGLVDSMLGRSFLDPSGAVGGRDGLPAEAVALIDVHGAVGPAELDATLEAIIAVRTQMNALEAREALLLERVRRQALRAETALLDGAEPMVRAASVDRRRELAHRAVVAEVALAVHQEEHAVAARMDRAQALVARAPRTLAGAVEGQVPWANAARVAHAVAELDERAAARLDAEVAHAASCQNARRFARTVRRARERVHATPPEVRHAEAATKRGVWVDPAADGMAYLTLFAPAPAVHAIADRITTVGRSARGEGDGRTLAQLRADVACALLLDDGTLDDGTLDLQPGSGAENAELEAEPFGRNGFSLAAVARSVRPKIYVTVPVLTLLDRTDEPALLDGTVPIAPDTARELAGLATSFTRLLTHPETGQILAVGSESYRPPADLRHYLKVRDSTCRFPGCARPASAADDDHTLAHADGGRTEAGNLAALCRRHHVLKHQSRFTVRHTSSRDGTLIWTTPTGRTLTSRPDPVPTTLHRSTRPPAQEFVPDCGDPPF
ncbi:HNH endonuclease signature motif containing protein [Xylanimonas sp. McL0601]|uniref:HNH endonuclease signature motif containing protein n=1 Tax=Xylanimonas sp. McL0601 TaxID=3414739 RepID=UPI003CF20651